MIVPGAVKAVSAAGVLFPLYILQISVWCVGFMAEQSDVFEQHQNFSNLFCYPRLTEGSLRSYNRIALRGDAALGGNARP